MPCLQSPQSTSFSSDKQAPFSSVALVVHVLSLSAWSSTHNQLSHSLARLHFSPEDLEAQAKRFDTDVRSGWITKVDFSGDVKKVFVGDGDNPHEIHANTVIISTGASAKWLGLESEIRLRDIGGGVSACAVCDGFFYRGQDVVIVGAGDSACEEASYLAKLCRNVTMLVRRDEMRASKAMQNRVKSIENIKILYNTETVEVLVQSTIFSTW